MEYLLEFIQGQQVTAGIINDISEWGSPARTARANILLLSQNDKGGVRTYLTIVNNDPLNTIQWAFTSEQDGWHQTTLLVFNLWDINEDYLANVNAIYHVNSGKFYKCKVNNTGVSPTDVTGPDHWEEITDFTLAQQGYTNVDVTDYNFAVESRTALNIADTLYSTIGETFLCKFQPDQAVDLLNLIATREGYRSKFIDDEPDQGEEIIRAMEAYFD